MESIPKVFKRIGRAAVESIPKVFKRIGRAAVESIPSSVTGTTEGCQPSLFGGVPDDEFMREEGSSLPV